MLKMHLSRKKMLNQLNYTWFVRLMVLNFTEVSEQIYNLETLGNENLRKLMNQAHHKELNSFHFNFAESSCIHKIN